MKLVRADKVVIDYFRLTFTIKAIPSLLAIIASSSFSTATGTSKRCLFITAFFYQTPNCIFTGADLPVDVNPATLLAKGEFSSAADANFQSCKKITTTTPLVPIMSFNFFFNGDGTGCTFSTYTTPDCKGTAYTSKVSVTDMGKCVKAPALPVRAVDLGGFKSYQVTCPG